MSYKRILTIQDISCLGQCSLTVALPILSAMGNETCILPSAVLSTHTGGFTGYTFRDLSDDMPAIADHWKKEGIRFDAFYTGYLGNEKQIAHVKHIMNTLGKDGSYRIVDPAMADFGRLYAGFDNNFVKAMASLCREADIILPNITEACLMTGIAYREIYDEAYIDSLLAALSRLTNAAVILTGVGFSSNKTGVMVWSDGKKDYYCHEKITGNCHGTGDVYASAFVGSLLRGKSLMEAAKIAADFTFLCIAKTVGDPDHRYGVKFELALPELIKVLA